MAVLQDETRAVEGKNADNQRVSPFSRRFITEKFLPWVGKGGLALLDFGLYSGSNFLLGILLARWMAPEQYGAYALVFSIFILVTFLYQALLLEPLSVFSGTTYSKNLRGYLQSNFWLHWGVSAVICALMAATAIAAKVWWHSPASAMAFAGMTAATPFILIHALGRRSFYLKLSPGPAAFGSSFYCVLVVSRGLPNSRIGATHGRSLCQAVRRNASPWPGRWCVNPNFLLDEPFAALDALTRLRMQLLVSELWRAHHPAVLLVTHDVDEALLLADRVLILDQGRIALDRQVDAPRPRRHDGTAFIAQRATLLAALGVTE